MSKDEAKQKICELVEKYEKIKASRLVSKYTEEETKKDFILPLFKILGWSVEDKNEVTAEEHQSSGRVDYGFYLNERLKFYLEAKSLKSDLNREDYANQAVKYSWNKGATWAILTDFENLKVFNAQIIDRSLTDKLFFDISYNQYIERFDQLWLLSKEAFEKNLIDIEAEKIGKKLQKVSVTALLYKDLDKCREILTHNLSQMNSAVKKDLLDEGVQRLLDRLIFLRVAEDRGIEPPTLIPLIRDWESKGRKENLYQSMIKKFRELDKIYNSDLFSEHPFEEWEEYSNATEKAINILYGKKGYYEYDFKAMPTDVLGSVYENYLGYRLSQSKKGVTISKDAKKRKEQGIYYTPTFIVDYIVKNALQPVLDKCKSVSDLKKIKVLDPACGSGSFLIKALELIHDKYIEFENQGGSWTKLDILLNNIYGVDLDPQAVEITRLNLLINALDKRMELPGLGENIKNGNSLISISGIDKELEKYFGKNFRDKNPFNWKEEFPEVFKQDGFDVVIGNPPYIRVHKLLNEDKEYFWKNFPVFKAKSDIYACFIQKAIDLLKNHGIISFIVSNTWLTLESFSALREYILNNCKIKKFVIPPKKVFPGASVETIIFLFEKENNYDSRLNNKIEIFNLIEHLPKLKTLVLQKRYGDNRNFNFILENSKASSMIGVTKLGKIQKILPLRECIQFAYGFKTGDDEKFITSDANQSSLTRKMLRRSDFGRYLISFDGEYVIYDPRKMIKNKKTARPGNRERFEQEKIIVQDIGKKIVATIDDQNYYVKDALILLNNKKSRLSLKYILAILNSKYINFKYKDSNL